MKPAAFLATALLGLLALAHLLRLILGVQVVAGGNVVPMWVSVPGFLVAAGIAVGLWRESHRP